MEYDDDDSILHIIKTHLRGTLRTPFYVSVTFFPSCYYLNWSRPLVGAPTDVELERCVLTVGERSDNIAQDPKSIILTVAGTPIPAISLSLAGRLQNLRI